MLAQPVTAPHRRSHRRWTRAQDPQKTGLLQEGLAADQTPWDRQAPRDV